MSEATLRLWATSEQAGEDGVFHIREEKPASRPKVALAYKRKDAALIVRAVNAHDDLVAACEAALGETVNGFPLLQSALVRDMIRAAIAKAKGT